MGRYDAFMAATAPEPDSPGNAELRANGVTVPTKYGKYDAFMSATEAPAPAEEPSMLDKYVVQPFKDLGNSVLQANDFAARAITHPVDTLGANPGAVGREVMRGVNSGIPFGRTMVEGLGGPAAESKEDTAAAPGAQAFGGFAGGAVTGKPVGGLLAKGAEAVAPVVGKAISSIGESAQGRQTGRALEDLEMKTYKRTRAGVRTDVVADVVAEHPEIREAAGNDAKLAPAVDKMKQAAAAEIDRHYGGKTVTLGDTIDNFNARIKALRSEGTSTDAAVADHLEKARDELTSRLGQRPEISVKQLRAEQTDFQGRGYGKAMPGDEAASARIEAAREASKAVGDAVVKRVTGVPYTEARALAEADPGGVAGRLLKANDEISAALKIEKSIADRASRVQPKEGVIGKLIEVGKEVRHSPVGYGLSLAPRAAAGAMTAVDNGIARLASPAPAAAGAAIARGASVAPNAMGRLIEMARAGLRGPELQAAAAQAGVPPDRVDEFAQLLAQHDARRPN